MRNLPMRNNVRKLTKLRNCPTGSRYVKNCQKMSDKGKDVGKRQELGLKVSEY